MKAFRFIALSIFSGTAVAQSVEDGLYELSDEETERAVVSIDGASYWLGKRFEITLDEKLVVSLDNDNERFQLTLRYRSDSIENISVARLLESGEASARFPRLVLVIDDTRYVNSGSSVGSGQEAAFFYIAGAENAERVAAFFGTEVRYRYHPGHKIRVRFSPLEQTIRLGDSVLVALEMTNVGEAPFQFEYSQRLPFRFFGTRGAGETIQRKMWPLRANDYAGLHSVQPGETSRIEANVANWLEFDQPGVYYVLGSYHMNFGGVGPFAIWSDLVSAEFVVTVEP